MTGIRQGTAGAAFGLALLFATGGLGFFLMAQAARLGVEAPPSTPILMIPCEPPAGWPRAGEAPPPPPVEERGPDAGQE